MTAKIAQMTAHVKDFQPISEEVHGLMLDATRRQLARRPVGKMRNLGPSLIDPKHPDHLFEYDANKRGWRFGTYVKYVKFYRPWRKVAKRGPMVSLKKPDREVFAEIVGQYVTAEETRRGVRGR